MGYKTCKKGPFYSKFPSLSSSFQACFCLPSFFFLCEPKSHLPPLSFSVLFRLKQPLAFSSSSFSSLPFQACCNLPSFGFFLAIQAVHQLSPFRLQQNGRSILFPVTVVALSFHRPPFSSFGSTGNQQHTPSSVTRFARHHQPFHLAAFFPC